MLSLSLVSAASRLLAASPALSPVGSRLDQVLLNPQPLPPKEAASPFAGAGALSRMIDDCGTPVPRRPIPPLPPQDPRAALEALLGGAGLPTRPPIPFF